jgi:hypothetical protein
MTSNSSRKMKPTATVEEQRRPNSSSSRIAHRPGYRPRSENYAPTNSRDAVASSDLHTDTRNAPFPRPPSRTPANGNYYYDDATNSGLFPAAAVGWSLYSAHQHHVVAAHQRALMLDNLVQAPFRTNNAGIVGAGAAAWMVQHQRYGVVPRDDDDDDDPRRSLHVILMLEARRELQARLALARLANRTTSPAGGRPPGLGPQHQQHSAADLLQLYERHSLGRAPPRPLPPPLLPIFPTTPTITTMTSAAARPRSSRRAEQSSPCGLDLLHTAAALNHLAGPVVISPQPSRASPGPPLATTATARTTGAALLPSPGGSVLVTETRSDSASHDAPSAPASPSRTMRPADADEETRFFPSSFPGRTNVETVQEFDILCGRGGRSNHHTGNKKYRHVVGYMKKRYQHCPGKAEKTDLSRQIVDYCLAYGARFLKYETATGQYYILSKDEARRKTSQALREPKMLKWTAM